MRKLFAVIGAELVIFGIPLLIGVEFLKDNAEWIVAIGLAAIVVACIWDAIPGLLARPFRWMGFRKKATSNQELIPISDALDIIVASFKSEWGKESVPGAHQIPAALCLRQAAVDGEIEITGRRESNSLSLMSGDRFERMGANRLRFLA